MMNKLATRDNGMNRQFKPQIYQSKRMEQSRNFYETHNYDRGNDQNRYRSNSIDRRIKFHGQCRDRPRYEQNYRRENFRGNMRTYQNFERIVGENIEKIIGIKILAEKEVGLGLGKGHFQGILIIEGMIGA